MSEEAVSGLPVITAENRQSIMDRAICINISRSNFGLTKTVNTSQVEVNTDKALLHIQKSLFDCKELKNIFSLDISLDAYLQTRCLPFPLKRGFHLLPIDLFGEVEQKLTEHITARKLLVDAFCAVYDESVAAALARLGALGNPTDYPPVDIMRNSFSFEYQYLQFNPAEALRNVSAEILQREQEKLTKQWEEAGDAVQQLLRANMLQLVTHMTDRLTPTLNEETGEMKKKVFKTSMLDKMRDFLGTFDARNLTNDAQLAALVNQAKLLTEGISPDLLRNNETIRNTVKQGFETLKSSLSDMVGEAPTRRIQFEDEPTAEVA